MCVCVFMCVCVCVDMRILYLCVGVYGCVRMDIVGCLYMYVCDVCMYVCEMYMYANV